MAEQDGLGQLSRLDGRVAASIEELEVGSTLAYVGLIGLGSLFLLGASVSVSA